MMQAARQGSLRAFSGGRMLYDCYEALRLAMIPSRLLASSVRSLVEVIPAPFRGLASGNLAAAALASFEHPLRHHDRPSFGLTKTMISGQAAEVVEEIIWQGPWCDLLHFRRSRQPSSDPPLLLVAPLSGHYATLIRETVATFLPDHDVFITDWQNARDVPITAPDFGLADCIGHVIAFLRLLGPETHVLAICQSIVPVLAAVSLMSEDGDPPRSMTLIGGPIDTRVAPTAVTRFAETHSIDWFQRHAIHRVPFGYSGFARLVYPGFLQLCGFMATHPGRHVNAYCQMFLHRLDHDGESLARQRSFYDEYFAVMDLAATFTLETIAAVFHGQLLPRGQLCWRGRTVDPAAIENTALFTIEGERDDVCPIGQTRAAHALCPRLPEAMRRHREQQGAGHFDLFRGTRFQQEIAPAIKRFIRASA